MTTTPRYLLMATHVPPSGSLGGVVRYTVALARALARRDDIELHVLAAADAVGYFTAFLPADRVHPVPKAPTAVHSLLERLGIAGVLRTERFDVVHGTKHIVPRRARGAVRVLTVHDMLMMDRARDFPLLKRVLLAAPYRASIRQADLLVAVSRATRARIVDHLPQVRDRVGVVPLAASSTLTGSPAEPVAALTGRRFALVVGDAGPRKNLELAVRTWDRVRERVPGAVLTVVGPKPWGAERHGGDTWDRLVTDGALVQLRDVSDGTLRWCYENAAAVLCPSLIEGFGLPTVEAAAFGTPVVTSEDPALCEASAGWGVPTAAWNQDDWVSTVASVLTGTEPPGTPPAGIDWDRIAADTVDLALRRTRPDTTAATPADRLGVSPYRAGLRVLHIAAPADVAAAEAVAAVHRANGWKVDVATDLPPSPDADVVVLHGAAVGRLRERLQGRVTTVLLADPRGPRTPLALLREIRLSRWTNALVLPVGADERWGRVHAPVTRLTTRPGAPTDTAYADELAAVLVRARAWGA